MLKLPDLPIFDAGWRPDPPVPGDPRTDEPIIRGLLEKLGFAADRLLPPRVDLAPWFPPVQYQGYYNTCTAHVVVSLLEYLENRAHGAYVPASRLFLYQITQRLLQESGDPGVFLRQMFGALVLIGVPPEKYWPYLDTSKKEDPRLEHHPDSFCYSVAADFKEVRPFRLDPLNTPAEKVLNTVRSSLMIGLPCSIGIPLYSAALVAAMSNGGQLGFPKDPDAAARVGSHAVLIVGFDDEVEIQRPAEPGAKEAQAGEPEVTRGAFRIRNSWGETWGEGGYGWLAYDYLLAGVARDCWTMIQESWVDTGAFQLTWEHSSPRGRADLEQGEVQPGLPKLNLPAARFPAGPPRPGQDGQGVPGHRVLLEAGFMMEAGFQMARQRLREMLDEGDDQPPEADT